MAREPAGRAAVAASTPEAPSTAMLDRSAAGVLVLLLAAPAFAGAAVHHRAARSLVVHARPARPAAPTLGIAVAPGVAFATPFAVVTGDPGRLVRVPHDTGPDGTCGGCADLVESVDGTPCGQDCTQRSLQRRGSATADRGRRPVPIR